MLEEEANALKAPPSPPPRAQLNPSPERSRRTQEDELPAECRSIDFAADQMGPLLVPTRSSKWREPNAFLKQKDPPVFVPLGET
ncbi:hypothetical protein EUGRSUZ_F02380 [Eucalyptus grandis]|uniref:Uncharacterized protein n=2 Tax=Eucalyptus grandis TaxID=71139 RepID=A0ACC3KGG3_EUCGR|nr:hypothetical protein EUGRSUZ_F02380 [Eucalyptus grandis]